MNEFIDYWDVHGLFFLIGCALFPRITTLLFSTVSFGFFHIIGWFIAPHFLVAILATTYYWSTNPILVVIAWFFAFGGTGTEGAAVKKVKVDRHRRMKTVEPLEPDL